MADAQGRPQVRHPGRRSADDDILVRRLHRTRRLAWQADHLLGKCVPLFACGVCVCCF